MGNETLVTTIEVKDEQGRVVDVRQTVTYAGLLKRAHEEGLRKVVTKLLQVPSAANDMTAICVAEVVTDKGTFREYGDANPGNVDPMIVPHLIRMAATRAKARAFRDAVNIGVVALEELVLSHGNGVDKSVPLLTDTPAAKVCANGSQPVGNGPPEDSAQDRPSPTSSGRSIGSDRMSKHQCRLLLRILAQHGVTGETAIRFLLHAVGVGTVEAITKKAASDLIADLLANAKVRLAEVVVP